jgi:pimeloyl-ACP methyl ester carboxylesterase
MTFFIGRASASNCESLAKLHLPNGAITAAESISTHTFTPPTGRPLTGLPPFCRVTATLKPSPDSDILIELWMPLAGWNQRLEGTGNGGLAGKIAYPTLAEGLLRGYAVANTDMGMATPPGATATVFINRPERWADWGYRATHEMTVAAKQIVHAFYSQDARHAYFVGCSTGGQQALAESQRYPDDYEGIVGGAPAQNRTGVHESILWNFAANERSPASYLPATARNLLSQAAMNACDSLDGVKDGIINDPGKCTFDPSVLACTTANQENCLTAPQVETAKQLYSGPVNPRTRESLYPGLPRGSEFAWEGIDAVPGGPPPFGPIFQWVFGPTWTWPQFDFDQQHTAFTQKLAAIVNATNPDIDAFRKHGHKMILYHGWSDWLVPPGETINYYQAVVARAPESDQSLRLFMVPGMSHCANGPGATHFDALGALIDWVERGTAPDQIMASKLPPEENVGKPVLQRPLCPYPRNAQYQGSGDPNDAANFICK